MRLSKERQLSIHVGKRIFVAGYLHSRTVIYKLRWALNLFLLGGNGI